MSSSTKALRVGQYVRVRLSNAKTEIGQIEDLCASTLTATVSTSSGFTMQVKQEQLSHAILLIVDLNGVLGFRKKSKTFKPRPYAAEFLAFIFRHFVVGVWSSCIEENGHAIVSSLFGPKYEDRLLFKMFRPDCTPSPTVTNKYGTVKDLRRVWERYAQTFDHRNTIIVDDSDIKCSHRTNALCPTPYEGTEAEDELENLETDTSGRIGLRRICAVLDQVQKDETLDAVRAVMVSINAAKAEAERLAAKIVESDEGATEKISSPDTTATSSAKVEVKSEAKETPAATAQGQSHPASAAADATPQRAGEQAAEASSTSKRKEKQKERRQRKKDANAAVDAAAPAPPQQQQQRAPAREADATALSPALQRLSQQINTAQGRSANKKSQQQTNTATTTPAKYHNAVSLEELEAALPKASPAHHHQPATATAVQHQQQQQSAVQASALRQLGIPVRSVSSSTPPPPAAAPAGRQQRHHGSDSVLNKIRYAEAQ